MAGKLYVLGDVDLEAIDRELGSLRPARVGVETLLEGLRGRMARQLARGVSLEQVRGVLKKHGVAVSERRLREFIDAGGAGAADADGGGTGEGGPGAEEEAGAGGSAAAGDAGEAASAVHGPE